LKVYQDYDGLVLKYKIPEDKYKSVKDTAYTKNSDLESTAYVYVVVKDSILNSQDYLDVSEADWYTDSVDFVNDQKIMSGVGNDLFAPDSTCTRAMMATILWKMHGSEAPTIHSPFSDLTADWYKNAVIWAAENGIANGVSDKGFAPELNVTREQFAAFLYRYAQFKEGILDPEGTEAVFTPAHMEFEVNDVDLAGFKDSAEVSDYAMDAVKWAVEQGIISGTPEGNIDPKGTATRAEIATMIARYL
ncbi:MAG: S-layer homology domain-containing protein, partial [Firmicutes bacterium]|nr:S-layer homology domain-containing protein [Bacillota bacterium]